MKKYFSVSIIIFLAGQLFVANWLFLSAKPVQALTGWADHIVISEIATGGPGGDRDEFVELYNPSPFTVNIGGWKFERYTALGTTTPVYSLPFSTPTNISAFGFYLITSTSTPVGGYSGPTTPNIFVTPGLGFDAGGGHFVIRDSDGNEIDRVGWGSALAPEGGVAAPLQGGNNTKSIERKPGNLNPLRGNGVDTTNNGNDFILRDNREPQRTSSPAEPIVAVDPLNIYVDAANTGLEDGSQSFPFNTISEGVVAVSSGGTVNTAAGIYDEQVVIDKSLTLKGAGNTTIIRPSSAAKLTTILSGRYYDGTDTQVAGIAVANVPAASNVIVKNLKIDGSNIAAKPVGADRAAGIFYRETSGKIDTVAVDGVRCDIAQVGKDCYGIYLSAIVDPESVEIGSSTITNFDKNGIQAIGSTLTVNVHDNTITGRGPLPGGDEVQNGILVADGANGAVIRNTISNLAYIPETWWSAGIMFYEGNGSANNNIINNSQIGVLFQDASGAGQNNTVNGGTVGIIGLWAQYTKAGIWNASFKNNTVSNLKDSILPMDGAALGSQSWNPGASVSFVADNNQLNSIATTSADGVYIGDIPAYGPAGNIVAAITNNIISGWAEGIHLVSSVAPGSLIVGNKITNNITPISGIHIEPETNATAVVAHNNEIIGNLGYGIYNGNAGLFNAENNWWGTNIGPFHPVLNPMGIGDAVSDNVDFDPWKTIHPYNWRVDDDKIQCPEAEFQTIQSAIDHPMVLAGDSIVVCDGTYNENVLLNKKVNLKSLNGPDVTTIDGTGLLGNGISASGILGVEISGFSVASSSAAGILLENSNKISVKQNKIHHNRLGIEFINSDQNNISHNKIYEHHWSDPGNWLEGNGIVAWDTNPAQTSDKNEIRQNDIWNSDRNGIIVGTSGGFVNQTWKISYNKVTGSGANGIEMTNHKTGEIRNNDVGQSGIYGILVSAFGGANSSGHKIERNEVKGSLGKAGIYLIGSGGTLQNNQVNRNESSNNTQNGILIEASHKNQIENNETDQNGQSGILLKAANRNNVKSNNSDKNAQYGIGLTSSSSNNSVERNRTKDNVLYDLYREGPVAGNSCRRNNFTTSFSVPPGWWR